MNDIPQTEWTALCERLSADLAGSRATLTVCEPGGHGTCRTVWHDRRLHRVSLERDEEELIFSLVATVDRAGRDPVCYRVEHPQAVRLGEEPLRLQLVGEDGWRTELTVIPNR